MAARGHSGGSGKALPLPAPRPEIAGSIEVVIAGLVDLDLKGLRLQWRNHLGGTPPSHLPRWLLLRVLAYQIQVTALGGLDKTTLRVIGQPRGQTLASAQSGPFVARLPATREGANLRAGAILVREWKGKPERVMVLEKGFAWNGKSYARLSQIAKAMTGTSWNGHRFFGLRTAKSDPATRTSRRGRAGDAKAKPDVASAGLKTTRQLGHRCSSSGDANAPAAGSAAAHDRRGRNDVAAVAS